MEKTLISIIVPVYNVEPYISKCLDSIIVQTYQDWECVLVDDGSTDGSGAICDEYAMKDNRFVVVHKQNEGVAKARITAYEHSKGELITFIDSDDYISPEYLEKLSKPILEQDADMVSCNYYIVEDDEIKEDRARICGSWENEQIQAFIANHYFYDDVIRGYGMTIFLWTKMIRRGFVLEGLQQGEDMWYAEDQIAVFHILQRCKKLILLPDRLYYHVLHEGQAMKRYDYSLWENLILLMEKYQNLDKNNVAERGRRYRMWLHIKITVREKMLNAYISPKEFCHHLSKMRNHPFIEQFFRSFNLELGKKDKIIFWLLREQHYMLLFLLFKIRIHRK